MDLLWPLIGCSSIQEIQRDAFQAQQLVLLLVIDADHYQRDPQGSCSFFKQPLGAFGYPHAVIPRRVVTAGPAIVRPRLQGRRLAVTRTTVTFPMSEDRKVSGVVLVVERGGGIGVRQIEEDADEARLR